MYLRILKKVEKAKKFALQASKANFFNAFLLYTEYDHIASPILIFFNIIF